MWKRNCIGFLLFLMIIASCRPPVFPPKPPGYFRIDTPAQHQYKVFDQPGFPYTFEYPVYSFVFIDTANKSIEKKNPFWINIVFPNLNGVINITYHEVSKESPLEKLKADSWYLTFVHHEKADSIGTMEFDNLNGTKGVLLIVGGNTASRYQFVISDSVKHFARGALYFDVTPNADSLKPANDFIGKDIEHLLQSWRWR